MATGRRTAYRPGVLQRLPELQRRYGDLLLAVALSGLMVVQVVELELARRDEAIAVAAGLLVLPALALRTRYPLAPIGLVTTLGLLGLLLPKRITDIEAFGFIMLLAVYTAAAHSEGRRAWIAGGLTGTVALGGLLGDPEGVYLGGIIFFALLFGGPWLAGRVVRRRRLNEARLERERDAAEAAITEERARIARELHDVVAHAISVIVLQARGGRRMLETEPAETRTALDAIEHTGQTALTEMRRLVGLLREGDEELALAPQPSVARLDALVAHVRDAGLPVEVTLEGEPVELPPGVDLSAYRIVQEALTNALRHAGPARARETLRYADHGLEVEVADDGVGANGANGAGHGLVGIRERVAVVGGELAAGPRPEGGFAVHARLPYASER